MGDGGGAALNPKPPTLHPEPCLEMRGILRDPKDRKGLLGYRVEPYRVLIELGIQKVPSCDKIGPGLVPGSVQKNTLNTKRP